ncbi:MAG TPA: hypothetical protein VIU93_01920 [Gallionellaceae bacterium]
MNRLTYTLLCLSAVYSVAAVATFILVLGPFGENRFSLASFFVVAVLLPHLLLFLAIRRANPLSTTGIFAGAAALVATIGGFLYSGSFWPNDGEYAIVYYIAPAAQLVVVAGAVLLTLWRKRCSAP